MMLSEKQTSERRRSIGSTDSAAILGMYHPDLSHLSKMKNATDVWLRVVHGVDLPQKSVMNRGILVEPKLRDLYRKSIGPVDDPPGTIRHQNHAWMVGSPDGLSKDELVEYKTVGKWSWASWGDPGSDKVPDAYNIQVQHLMEVCGRSTAVVLAAFGTDVKDTATEQRFVVDRTGVYVIKKNDALVSEIINCGARFFREHIETGISPSLKPLCNIRKWTAILKQQHQPEAQI